MHIIGIHSFGPPEDKKKIRKEFEENELFVYDS